MEEKNIDRWRDSKARRAREKRKKKSKVSGGDALSKGQLMKINRLFKVTTDSVLTCQGLHISMGTAANTCRTA